jgi:hypothetical protein
VFRPEDGRYEGLSRTAGSSLWQSSTCSQSNETHGHSWDLRHLDDAYELLKLGEDVRDTGRWHEDLDMSGVIQIKRFEQQVLDRGLFAA